MLRPALKSGHRDAWRVAKIAALLAVVVFCFYIGRAAAEGHFPPGWLWVP